MRFDFLLETAQCKSLMSNNIIAKWSTSTDLAHVESHLGQTLNHEIV